MHKASALRLCVPSAPTKASHVLPQLDFAASIGQRCLIGHVRATTYCGHVATTDAEATEVLQQPALAKFSCHDLRNRPVVADDVAVLDISSPHNCNSTSAGGSDRCSTARLGPASHGTQQRLQQQQHDNTAPQEEYQKSLCRMLRSEHCLSLHQLAEVITEHGCYMDGQSLAASFTAAARVCRLSVRDEQQCDSRNTQPSVPCTQQQVLQVLEQHLVPVMLGKLRHMDAMGLQMVLYSLATLQCKQEPVIMQLVRPTTLQERLLVLPVPGLHIMQPVSMTTL